MAAVFIPPSPQTSLTMASRRPPLANVANGTNSPLRSANLLATKRSQPESASFNEPPLKRQMRDQENNAAFRKPAISTHANPNDAKIFSRRDNSAAPSAFERKLVAVREKDGTAKATKQAKATGDSLESVRQWQRHYRKVFPQFVFYFESVSNDLRDTFARQVRCLGAVSCRSIHCLFTFSQPEPTLHPPTSPLNPVEILPWLRY
jgi:regulatory subunit for Cdc7p protein kinase